MPPRVAPRGPRSPRSEFSCCPHPTLPIPKTPAVRASLLPQLSLTLLHQDPGACIVYTGRPGAVSPSALGWTWAMVQSAREKRRSAVARTPNIKARRKLGLIWQERYGKKAEERNQRNMEPVPRNTACCFRVELITMGPRDVELPAAWLTGQIGPLGRRCSPLLLIWGSTRKSETSTTRHH